MGLFSMNQIMNTKNIFSSSDRSKLQQAVFLSVIVAIAVYGINYHAAKTILYLSALLGVINVMGAIYKRDISLLSIPPNIRIFLGLLIASVVIVAVYTSFSSGKGSDRFFRDFCYTATCVIFISVSLKLSEKDLSLIESAILFSCITMGLIGIFDYFINNPGRTSGSINNPLDYGTNLSILATLSVMIATKYIAAKRYKYVLFCVIAFLTGSIGVVLSASRGPLVAELVVIGVITLIFGIKCLGKRNALISMSLFIVIIGYGISTLPVGQRFHDTFINISENNEGSSIGRRIQQWQAGLRSITDNPMAGIGVANHNDYFRKKLKEDPFFIHPSAMFYTHIHNDIINMVVWMGAVSGLVFFGYLIYSFIVFLVHAKVNYIAALGLVTTSNYLLCGLTSVPSIRAVILTMFLLLIVIFHQMMFLPKYAGHKVSS